MRLNLKNAIALGTLILLGRANAANAQTRTFYPNNATIDYTVNTDYAIVGYANDGDYSASPRMNPSSPNVLFGGSVNSLYAYNSSTVTVNGGTVSGLLFTYDSSTVTVNGGIIGNFVTYNNSTVNFRGGSITDSNRIGEALFTHNSSTVNFSGGSIPGGVVTFDSSTVNFSGGSIGKPIIIFNSSTVNIFGSGLAATLINPNDNQSSQYSLSGTLQDGTLLTNTFLYVHNGTGASFHLFNAPKCSVSGTLNFRGLVAQAAPQNVTFTFRPNDGSMPVVQTLSVLPIGTFTIPNLPSKPGILHIKPDHFLAGNVAVDLSGGNVSGITAKLQPGDANNDNSVDSTDFGLLIGAYGRDSTILGSGYDVGADFNGDGSVDSTDFGILIGNFNLVGAD